MSRFSRPLYEFGRQDFETELLDSCTKNNIDPSDIFKATGSEGKGELKLHDLIVSILKHNGIENISVSPSDTLDATNPWPSHRLFSKGNESKKGRLLAGMSTESI